MKQFITSDVCLSCDGCCQFNEEKSEWRAKAGQSEEKAMATTLNITEEEFNHSYIEKGGYLKDRSCHGIFTCEFFNEKDHTCAVYQNRPFECRLYPFVLTMHEGKPSVSVHLPCPFIEKVKGSDHYNDYVAYLKEMFKEKDILELLRSNKHLFGTYHTTQHELELVFHIDDVVI